MLLRPVLAFLGVRLASNTATAGNREQARLQLLEPHATEAPSLAIDGWASVPDGSQPDFDR